MLRVKLPDVEATEAFGAALAHEAKQGDVFFLRGELGSGKTSLARGFLRRFFGNTQLDVPSPSYLLHFVYCSSESPPTSKATGADTDNGTADETVAEGQAAKVGSTGTAFRASDKSLVPNCPVHHIDPFRLPDGKIASLINFERVFAEIALVEWPNRLGAQLVTETTPGRLEIVFEGFGPQAEGRSVVLSGVGSRWHEVVERWVREQGPFRFAPSDPAPLPADIAPESTPVKPIEENLYDMPSSKRNCRALPEDVTQWRVLGIESSCDDTGAAVLTGTGSVLGEALASQARIHEEWGGVVPKLAQKAHSDAIDATVDEALKRAGVSAAELTAVAVTVGPGLGLCLEVGVRKALQIAAEHRLPLVRVHHMEAHTLVTRLPAKPSGDGDNGKRTALTPAFPFVTLLVSGGHNLAVLTRGIGKHTILGSTIDDSVGEAFDKTARILGITQIPGGPHLERLAKDGDSEAYSLPKPLSKSRDRVLQTGCDFSFAGLKTATRTLVEKELPSETDLTDSQSHTVRANIAASFQRTAVDHLADRAARAVDWAQELEPSVEALVVAGGVAANQSVRSSLNEIACSASWTMHCPPPKLCVDNGVMVAWAGIERLLLGLYEEPPTCAGIDQAVEIRPRWPLGPRDPRSRQQKGTKEQQKRPVEDTSSKELPTITCESGSLKRMRTSKE